jgi:hypothetical protein
MRRRPSGNAVPYRPAATVGYRGHASGAGTQGADADHAAFSQLGLARWQTIDMPQTYWLDLKPEPVAGTIPGVSGQVEDAGRRSGRACTAGS